MTIHKCQGLTLERVVLNLGTPFEFGMTYVALSRCKSLAGIRIKGKLTEEDIFVSEDVTEFYLQYCVQPNNEYLRKILREAAEPPKRQESNSDLPWIKLARQPEKLSFRIPIPNLQFEDGRVEFEIKYSSWNINHLITIPNAFLKKEYNGIKGYFMRLFGKKSINVEIAIQRRAGAPVEITHVNAPEIDQINQQLIREIKWTPRGTHPAKKLEDIQKKIQTPPPGNLVQF